MTPLARALPGEAKSASPKRKRAKSISRSKSLSPKSSTLAGLALAAAREVVELHAFFVDAFTGRKRDFARAEGAFSPDLLMVTPEGRRVNRAQIMDALVKARARPDFRITIHDIRPVSETERGVLLQYIEEQYRDGETSKRVSVALFEAAPEAPCGVVWRYLQETWIVD